MTWLHADIPDAFLNEVSRTHLLSSGRDELIDETLAHFRQRKVRKLSWWACRRGYRISILQDYRLGYTLYPRLGFQDYGKLNIYEWDNESESPVR